MDATAQMASLRNELCVWRSNRRLYPGWLIAPYQTRDTLWRRTRYWLDLATQAGEEWTSSQALVLWRELAWRLETCLHLVPDNAVNALRNSIEGVERHQETREPIFEIESFMDENWPVELKLSSQELQEDWIECMLSLLLSYRFRPDLSAFQTIVERLNELEYLSQNQECEVLYQSSLVALAEMDRETATLLMESWPREPEDPYWLVRKAGVYLELGDQLSATAAATNALEKIRRRRNAKESAIWGLSREGWCLRFLSQISQSNKLVFGNKSERHEQDVAAHHPSFDRELEESRCSPDSEMHLIQERILGRVVPPRPIGRTRNSPAFDTGEIGETIHFGSYEPAARLGAAVNILRLWELSGVPPSVGNVGFYREAVSNALLWIRDEYPGLWAAFVLRLGGIGIDEYREPGSNIKQNAIRRATLDVLPIEHIRRLSDATIRELRRVVSVAYEQGNSSEGMERHDAIQAIRRLGDAATRFSMCLGDKDREEVFVVLLRVSSLDTLARNPILRETLWNMARRTVAYFSTELVNKWVTEIYIQFPLISKQRQKPFGWPEVSSYVRSVGKDKPVRPISAEFDKGVGRFIDLLSSGNLIDRTGAARRLLNLYDSALLSETECEAYRFGLWNELDDNGLPKISQEVLPPTVHLKWPGEEKTKVLEGLRSWVLSEVVSDRFTPQESQDAGEEIQYSVSYPDTDIYLAELWLLSLQLSNSSDAFEQVFCPQVRTHILSKILEWWSRERGVFLRQARRPQLFGGDVFHRVEIALQVLFSCVLEDRMECEANGSELRAFLDDLSGIGRAGVYWHQVAAFLGVVSVEEYWARVRTDLWGDDSHSANKALESGVQWMRKRDALALEAMPRDVWVTNSSEIANVRGERCRQVCRLITQLVEMGYVFGEELDRVLVNSVVNAAAGKLVLETAEGEPHYFSAQHREMFPHLRRELTRLFVAMERQGFALDEVVERWLRTAKEDRFVDVRVVVEERNT